MNYKSNDGTNVEIENLGFTIKAEFEKDGFNYDLAQTRNCKDIVIKKEGYKKIISMLPDSYLEKSETEKIVLMKAFSIENETGEYIFDEEKQEILDGKINKLTWIKFFYKDEKEFFEKNPNKVVIIRKRAEKDISNTIEISRDKLGKRYNINSISFVDKFPELKNITYEELMEIIKQYEHYIGIDEDTQEKVYNYMKNPRLVFEEKELEFCKEIFGVFDGILEEQER